MALEGWAVDTSVRKGSGGVNVGNSWVPKRFRVDAEGETGGRPSWWVHVTLQCSTEDGKLVRVHECWIGESEPGLRITTGLLRRIPVTGLARLGMWSMATRRNDSGQWERVIREHMPHRWTELTPAQYDGPDEDVPRTAIWTTDVDAEWVAQLDKDYGKLVEARRGVGVRTDEWWRKVEEAYLDAIERREHTGAAVAKAMHLSNQAAKNAITEARRHGLNLPKRGRVK